MRILLVEDDNRLADLLRRCLEEAGYSVRVALEGNDALEQMRTQTLDLVVSDVLLPGIDGFTLCRRIRAMQSDLPILLLTARAGVEDRVAGLDAGADDYVVKPFELPELLARVRALLRRRAILPPTTLSVGDLFLNTSTREARRDDHIILLSNTEYTLLEYLMRNAGSVLTRAAILAHVWQYDFGGNDNVLDLYISYLRNKIDKGKRGRLIHTVRGIGFLMERRDKTGQTQY